MSNSSTRFWQRILNISTHILSLIHDERTFHSLMSQFLFKNWSLRITSKYELSTFWKRWSHIIIETVFSLYIQFCSLTWCVTLHVPASVLEPSKKRHLVTYPWYFCYFHDFMTTCLLHKRNWHLLNKIRGSKYFKKRKYHKNIKMLCVVSTGSCLLM